MASLVTQTFRWSRANPNIAKNIPTYEFVKDGSKKIDMIYVCGFGATGSLGMERFYKPDKSSLKKLTPKQVGSSHFKRLYTIKSEEKIHDIGCGYGFTILAGKFSNTSHSVLGFGLNTHSQIGFQASRPGYPLEIVNTPSPIYLPTKEPVLKVSCGRAHSLLLTKAGKVFAIGNNAFGQCGRKIKKNEEYFGSKIISHLTDLPKDITSVECGQDHSMFLSEDGKLFACGWGADGQTGLGHYENQSQPMQVRGDIDKTKIVKVSSFADTVLALDDQGNVFGWGNSEYSQLNVLARQDGKQFNIPRALDVKVPGKVTDVAAGGTMCAILNDQGQVFVWGFGILGHGPNVDQSSKPTLIPESLFGMNCYNPDVKVTNIYAGLSHFAAINSQGDLFMWGKNRGSALGFHHRQDQFFPMRADVNLSIVKKVALGIDHTCALTQTLL